MKRMKSDRSARRNAKRDGQHPEQVFAQTLPPPRPTKPEPFQPRTEKQRKYASSMRNKDAVVFGIGPAGTGKTYVAGCMAAEALANKEVKRIILTRPVVEAVGEKMGYLPGEKEEKFDPYFDPFREVLEERLGESFVKYLIETRQIRCEPFAYMRGKTFKDAFVILDEAQNATPEHFKLFLTRKGEGSRVVIDGDENQPDIRNSGLIDAANRLLHISSVRVVFFEKSDIVRCGFVQEVVEAYEAPAPAPERINPMLQR